MRLEAAGIHNNFTASSYQHRLGEDEHLSLEGPGQPVTSAFVYGLPGSEPTEPSYSSMMGQLEDSRHLEGRTYGQSRDNSRNC